MKRWLKKLWLYLRSHYKYVLATLGIIASLFLLYFVKNDIQDLKILNKKVGLAKDLRKIGQLEGQKSQIALQVSSTESEIKEIDSNIEAISKEVSRKKASISRMTTKQKLDKFNELGY